MAKEKSTALVLSGGGARAAYQAGALKAVIEIHNSLGKPDPAFTIFTGESAGAINASLMAMHVSDLDKGVEALCKCWDEVQMHDIFETGPVALLSNAARWAKELSFGGLFQKKSVPFLLDASPLRHYLAPKINFSQIRERIADGVLKGLGISVTNYATGSAVTFFDSLDTVPAWSRSHRLGLRTELKLDHVLASTAIPILFPPIRIGHCYFGDGSVRLKAPLSPAIHLGAERILAIGLRYYRTPDQTVEINQNWKMSSISLADVAGVLLNAGFLDNLDADLERLERVNHTLDLIPAETKKKLRHQLRPVKVLALRPSRDLGRLASEEFDRFNILLRYLLKGLGMSRTGGWDLMSYLAFDSAYTKKLISLGYKDTMAVRDKVEEFFS